MAAVNRIDIESVLSRYFGWSHGYLYLPAENVEDAKTAIGMEFENVLVYVKESKLGFKRLYVDKVTAKRITRLLDVPIREKNENISGESP